LLAVMGPSGAGKSSLLAWLAAPAALPVTHGAADVPPGAQTLLLADA